MGWLRGWKTRDWCLKSFLRGFFVLRSNIHYLSQNLLQSLVSLCQSCKRHEPELDRPQLPTQAQMNTPSSLNRPATASLSPRFYVTPKAYLDFLSLYSTLVEQQGSELGAARDRLLNGIAKLQVHTRYD